MSVRVRELRVRVRVRVIEICLFETVMSVDVAGVCLFNVVGRAGGAAFREITPIRVRAIQRLSLVRELKLELAEQLY